jgi:hypothetical protein
MAAELARNLAFPPPKRVLVLLLVLVNAAPFFLTWLPIEVDASWVVTEDTLGSRYGVQPVIRPGIGDVMLQSDRRAVDRFDE